MNGLEKHNNEVPHVLVLFGPTASGKTSVLFKLFEKTDNFQAEVISADSMQVYRGMDIGTAKPSVSDRLPHHLIDIRDPGEQFNAGDFVRLADEACMDITRRGKLPVVSGGTGFYLKNFIMGLSEAPPSNENIRTTLKKELLEKGALALMEELALVDPVSANRIHKNDEYRLLRALEVWRVCSRPLSSFEAPTLEKNVLPNSRAASRFKFIIIGLSLPREELYRRINLRCEAMFAAGLEDEVQCLYKAGYTPDDPGLRAIGYREFFVKDIETGEWRLSSDITGVKALVAQNSRRYAKRQITFFAGIPDVKWVDCSGGEEQTVQCILEELTP